jgi:hypothetical protein
MIILSILEDIFPPFSGFLGTLRRFDPCDKSDLKVVIMIYSMNQNTTMKMLIQTLALIFAVVVV